MQRRRKRGGRRREGESTDSGVKRTARARSRAQRRWSNCVTVACSRDCTAGRSHRLARALPFDCHFSCRQISSRPPSIRPPSFLPLPSAPSQHRTARSPRAISHRSSPSPRSSSLSSSPLRSRHGAGQLPARRFVATHRIGAGCALRTTMRASEGCG